MKIQDIMQKSGVAFGTSGARGLVFAMTDQVCFAYTQGFLRYLRNKGEYTPGSAVAIAGDLRPSTPRILQACAAAILAEGGQVDFCGYVPSPAVALYGFSQNIPSLMVTGSHIPDDRNGIKFNRPAGELLKTDEPGLRMQEVEFAANSFDTGDNLLNLPLLGKPIDVLTTYRQRYLDFFGATALAGMHIGIYQHSAVGRDALADILQDLGANITLLGRTDTFTPVDTEAIRPEDVALAAQWASSQHFDAIVSTDGDSDRPLVSDHHGTWLRGDVLGILTAQALGANTVVTPVSSNTALEKSQAFSKTVRTRIGSPYVVTGMTDAIADQNNGELICGFEANGGFLTATDCLLAGEKLTALPTRDAVLPIVTVLASARKQDKSLKELVTALPPRYTYSDRLKDFPTQLSQSRLARFMGKQDSALEHFNLDFSNIVGSHAITLDLTDGVRVTFANGDIIHLRPSGNAPELRCYTESDSPERAQILCANCVSRIESWRHSPSPE